MSGGGKACVLLYSLRELSLSVYTCPPLISSVCSVASLSTSNCWVSDKIYGASKEKDWNLTCSHGFSEPHDNTMSSEVTPYFTHYSCTHIFASYMARDPASRSSAFISIRRIYRFYFQVLENGCGLKVMMIG